MASNSILCSNCNKREEDAASKLLNCSVCMATNYCSAQCQKDHWTAHKASCTKGGCLLLIAAIQANDANTVTRLSKTKRVLNGKVDYTPPPTEHRLGNWTALHECVRKGNKEMMKILVAGGANLEIKDVDGETPTFVASDSQNPELIQILLDGGANPNALAQDGWSCLMVAARSGDYGTVKALLDAGADQNHGGDMFGRTALDISSQQASGQGGILTSKGESLEEARAKHMRVASLLSEYAARN